MSRRKFLIGAGATAAVIAAGGATALFTGSEKDSLVLEQVTDETTLEESLQHIQSEIELNRTLPSIEAYGDEKIRSFINHSFNIFRHTTGSKVSMADFIADSEIGNAARLKEERERINRGPIQGEDHRMTGAQVYKDAENKKKIMINKDAYSFQLQALLQAKASGMNVSETVLENLLDISLHEPFHYETKLAPIDPPFVYTGADDIYTFHESSGWNIFGKAQNTQRDIAQFSTLEEMSVYLLQRDIIQPKVPFYTHRNPYKPYLMDNMQSLMSKGGYTTPDQMLELRRGDHPIEDILNVYGQMIPSTFSTAPNPQGRALEHLGKINNAMSAEFADEFIQQYIDVIGSDSTSQIQLPEVAFTPTSSAMVMT